MKYVILFTSTILTIIFMRSNITKKRTVMRSLIFYFSILFGLFFSVLTLAVTPITQIENDRLFTFAEANYPTYFPATATDQQFQQYTYRYYPTNGNYLAIDTSGTISMLGPFTNNVITVVGPVSNYTNAIIAWEATLSPTGYAPTNKLGSIGPAGGIVFYVDYTGLHGLEAQSADYNSQPGEMINIHAPKTWPQALTAASSYGAGWHLPTKEELNQLYLQRAVVGGFGENSYWSSTEDSASNAWGQNLHGNGGVSQYSTDKNYSKLTVRSVRAFDLNCIAPQVLKNNICFTPNIVCTAPQVRDASTNTCGALSVTGVIYKIGDKGPAGGKVFYLTNSTSLHGLEAAPVDQSVGIKWGCSDTTVGTSASIGAGKANTAAINAHCGTATAAQIAASYSLNGFTDWYLPSKDELNQLYLQKTIVGGGC